MRKSCLECVTKHLGSAAAYIEEVQMGYPNYFGYVYGQLDHAASECIESAPDLAWTIREHRIKWASTRKSENPHRIPFEALFDYIDTLEEVGDLIRVPLAAQAGLDIDEDGDITYSMDTRPEQGDTLDARSNDDPVAPCPCEKKEHVASLENRSDADVDIKSSPRKITPEDIASDAMTVHMPV